jgi:hypothetical protein
VEEEYDEFGDDYPQVEKKIVGGSFPILLS